MKWTLLPTNIFWIVGHIVMFAAGIFFTAIAGQSAHKDILLGVTLDTHSPHRPRDLPVVPTCRSPAKLCVTPNQIYIPAIPSRLRGVSRSSRTLERDAVDAAVSQDE
jgi:hypothetical protein